jgi:hypothetical protein
MRPSSGLVIALALASRAALGAPVNDVCSQATEVPEQFRNRYFATLDLATATTSPGDPEGACVSGPPEHTVWFRWTAENDGQLYVQLACTGAFEVVANVWEGTCAAPVDPPSCDTALCSDGLRTSTFVTADTEYLIGIGTPPAVGASSPVLAQLCFLGPDQDDQDDDGLADCIDDCTDEDRDGFGDGPAEERPFDACPPDNCPDVYNADQADKDGDGVGDACDTEEEKDRKTLQEAAAMDLVELSSKGCFTGDCIKIVIRNPGPRGLVVTVGPGDVLVSRDESEQDLGVSRPQNVYVPPGGTVTLGGLFTVCLELDRHGPSEERIYDVTDNLSALADRANFAALGALLAQGPGSGLQSAIWAITESEGQVFGEEAQRRMRAAGLDPAALPTGGFPALINPNAGSTSPTSRFLAGLLAAAPPDCELEPSRLPRARCLLDRTDREVAALDGSVKPKVRKQLVAKARAVRARVEAAIAAGNDAKKSAKRTRAAKKRANALLRFVTVATRKQKLPQPAAGALLEAAGQVALALSDGS